MVGEISHFSLSNIFIYFHQYYRIVIYYTFHSFRIFTNGAISNFQTFTFFLFIIFFIDSFHQLSCIIIRGCRRFGRGNFTFFCFKHFHIFSSILSYCYLLYISFFLQLYQRSNLEFSDIHDNFHQLSCIIIIIEGAKGLVGEISHFSLSNIIFSYIFHQYYRIVIYYTFHSFCNFTNGAIFHFQTFPLFYLLNIFVVSRTIIIIIKVDTKS